MAIQTLSPQAAQKMVEEGAIFVDIRSVREHQSESIANSIHQPIAQFAADRLSNEKAQKIIFYCHSGFRTKLNSAKFLTVVGKELFILQGGINAWKKANLPTIKGEKQSMEITRQLHIAIGSGIIIGSILGFTLSPWFYLLPFFFGCGLFFAGLTGFCGMVCLLSKMPWNNIKCK